MAAALERWFAARGRAFPIRELRRHAEGWSWQTWTFTGDGGPGYAVRRQPEDGLLAPYDIRGQYRLHQALLEHSEVPLPALVALELDSSYLGMPFYVMERVQGVVPVQWRGRDPEIFPDAATRTRIGHDFVDVLARIHAVDWRAAGLEFLGGFGSAAEAARAQVDRWEAMYAGSALVELPLVREALGWLRAHPATSDRLGLVHGDYRIGNFMLGPDRRINAVFDWELAHLGDPVEDIAYAGLPLFRGRDSRLSQLLEPAEFFDRYRERTGLAVDPTGFRWWTVLGLVKAISSHIRGTRAFEDGTADLRLAAMGHQAVYPLRQLQDVLEG